MGRCSWDRDHRFERTRADFPPSPDGAWRPRRTVLGIDLDTFAVQVSSDPRRPVDLIRGCVQVLDVRIQHLLSLGLWPGPGCAPCHPPGSSLSGTHPTSEPCGRSRNSPSHAPSAQTVRSLLLRREEGCCIFTRTRCPCAVSCSLAASEPVLRARPNSTRPPVPSRTHDAAGPTGPAATHPAPARGLRVRSACQTRSPTSQPQPDILASTTTESSSPPYQHPSHETSDPAISGVHKIRVTARQGRCSQR